MFVLVTLDNLLIVYSTVEYSVKKSLITLKYCNTNDLL